MSEFLFLGTGAADWSIENKGDFFRRNSAALLNGDLMIDCGEHIFDFANDFYDGNLYDNVSDIIITHSHSDHFCKQSILKLAENKKIRLGCDEYIKNTIGENENIEYIIFKPFEEKQIGKYSVIPLLANHDVITDRDKKAFHYIIKTPCGKTIFYGLDGAWFLRPSWQEMLKHKYDLMIFDCTVGDSDDWRIFEHNTIPMLRMMIKEVKNRQLLKETGMLVCSHFARTLHKSHEDTEQILQKIGVSTAFDGMKIEI